VKYVKGNFLPTRRFRDMADLNAQVREWVLQVAGQRIHGTTRVRPLESFAVERALLLPCRRCRRIWAPGTGDGASGLPRELRARALLGALRWWASACGCAPPTAW
jgi:hypothetical protein